MLGLLLFQKYKMNEIINSFLLEGDEFMPEMYLGQPELTYSAYHGFDKNKVKKNLKKTRTFKMYLSKRNRKNLFST